MGNIVRLSSGGQIQVRTGVLSGVGPAGPRGLIGPAGPDGGQGPDGQQGPMGQILQVGSKTVVSGTTNLTANVNGLISFGTVAYDDMGCITSATNFIFTDPADYLMSVYLSFNTGGASTGHRQVFLQSNINGTIHANQVQAIPSVPTIISFAVPFRTTAANEMIQVFGNSSQPVGVTAGAATLARIGSGPVGPTGPIGPQGVPGPQGVAGPQGPAGNANTGYATYADLL